MDVKMLNGLPTLERKLAELKNMNEEQKTVLVKEQGTLIDTKWDLCLEETNNRFKREFKTIENKIIYFDNLFSFVDWTFNKYTYKIKNQKHIFQWDIFYCDFGHNIGNEKNKTRPVLILQNMKDYAKSGTVMVAPITIGTDFDNLFKHEIVIGETKFKKVKGKVDLAHIRSVSRSRLDEYPKDRLLNEQEYKDKYPEKPYTTVQDKVKNALQYLFSLD